VTDRCKNSSNTNDPFKHKIQNQLNSDPETVSRYQELSRVVKTSLKFRLYSIIHHMQNWVECYELSMGKVTWCVPWKEIISLNALDCCLAALWKIQILEISQGTFV